MLAQPGVAISGGLVNTSVMFNAFGMSLMTNFDISIFDDEVGLENIEQFEIELTNSVPSAGVTLGPNARVTITDDDSELLSAQYESRCSIPLHTLFSSHCSIWNDVLFVQ